jgi:hypothetical protein
VFDRILGGRRISDLDLAQYMVSPIAI